MKLPLFIKHVLPFAAIYAVMVAAAISVAVMVPAAIWVAVIVLVVMLSPLMLVMPDPLPAIVSVVPSQVSLLPAALPMKNRGVPALNSIQKPVPVL